MCDKSPKFRTEKAAELRPIVTCVVAVDGNDTPLRPRHGSNRHEAVGCQGMYASANRKGVRKCHRLRRVQRCLMVAPLVRVFSPSTFMATWFYQ